MHRPEGAIPDDGVHQAVVDAVKYAVCRVVVALVRDPNGRRGRRNGDVDVRREDRGASGVGNPTEYQPAEGSIVRPDEVASRCGRIKVVHALRSRRAVEGGDEVSKVCDDERPSPEHGGLAHDVGRRVLEGRHDEPVHTNIECVGVDPQRRIVGKARAVAANRRVVRIEEEERPVRQARNRRPAAHRHHDAIVGAGQWHVDHHDEPPLGQAVVADSRVRRAAAADRCEKHVRVEVHDAVGNAGDLAERHEPAVERDDVLGGADIAHAVGRKGVGGVHAVERGRREVGGADRLGRERLRPEVGRPWRPGRHRRRVRVLRQAPAVGPLVKRFGVLVVPHHGAAQAFGLHEVRHRHRDAGGPECRHTDGDLFAGLRGIGPQGCAGEQRAERRLPHRLTGAGAAVDGGGAAATMVPAVE